MKCSYHPGAEALDICPVCGRPVCEQCTVSLSGKNYCRACLEEKVGRLTAPPTGKSRFLAFLLSLVPGGGYYYLGLMRRGLQTMVIFFGTIFIGALTDLDPLTAFITPIMVFYSVFDTQQLLSRMNEGQPVEDRELFDWSRWQNKRGLTGAGLIMLGLFALLDNLLPHYINMHYLGRFIVPLAIIGAGVYILYRNTSGRRETNNGSSEQNS